MTNQMKQIMDALVVRKEKLFEDFLKTMKDKEKIIEPISMDELEKKEKSEFKIKTGTMIDEIVGGGIPETKSMMLYGELASGKTQTCLTCVVLCPNASVYIDTEGSFRVERMKQICEARGLDWNEIKKKIIYFSPKNWAEQLLILFSLPSTDDVERMGMKVDLIVCDSISKHFRGAEFVGRENLTLKNGFIREFILALERLAEIHRAALIYTTQIYDTVSGKPFSSITDIQKPIGGRSAEHQPDFVIHFRKGQGNIRVARMVDSSWNPLAERAFVINEQGIADIPEEAPAHSTQEKYAQEFSKKQAQEKKKKKKKKKGEKDEVEEKTE